MSTLENGESGQGANRGGQVGEAIVREVKVLESSEGSKAIGQGCKLIMVQAQCLQASQSAELRNEGGKLVVATAQGVCTGTKRGGGPDGHQYKSKGW